MPKREPNNKFKKLPRKFYERDTLTVARELLGKIFVHNLQGKLISGKIVETEAYLGEKDAAAHTYRGKTKRNEVMFKEGGHLYVYFTYGMHYCANVVTEQEGVGHAVLLRAVQPVEGFETMRELRKLDTVMELANGPAKLCQAFGIARAQNGTDLLGDKIFICDAECVPASRIGTSERVGITKAKEFPWRFFIKGNPFVSNL